jgi:acyl-CoA synthetase (AMP-forming)/AMP-acid ligase II
LKSNRPALEFRPKPADTTVGPQLHMQSYRLTVDKFLDHAAKWFCNQEVVEANAGAVAQRTTYSALRERANRMSGALAALGLRTGDRVATLAWNSVHHLEIYYAAMGAGFVCHTLNPRLTIEQLAAIVNEAEDRILAVSGSLAGLAAELAPRCPTLDHLIILDPVPAADWPNVGGASTWLYRDLLAEHNASFAWGQFDEEAPAGLCYTSGTTGPPKGVLYTHRSNYLHTLRSLQADAMAIRHDDAVLVAVPMFHANGWGIPFAGPAVGAKLVLPERYTDGPSLAALMRAERVTIAVGVQTVWLGVAEYLEEKSLELPDLERVIIGGSHCPDALLRRLENTLGARVQTSWGMTELSPLGTISPPGRDAPAQASGRPPMGLDLKLTNAAGDTLPGQRDEVGHLRVKGASVIDHYFKAEVGCLDEEGYFDTGDLATLDEDGNLTITGRSKDLIKSGGEWINPVEMEAIIGRNPGVSLVAVISIPHDKWGERPLLVVQARAGESLDVEGLISSLRGKVANWWIPDAIARVQAMPLAGSGKIDKRRLRSDYESGRLLAEPIPR